MENWKDIENYEGLYQISDQGGVKSLNYHREGKEKILKQKKDGNYWRICLSKNDVSRYFLVHRLVATAFIPNPDNLPCINHKDENPSNNAASNLEWCTYEYNNNYGTHNQRLGKAHTNHPLKSKKVLQFTKSGEFIREFPSVREAERQTGINKAGISGCCLGREHYNTAGGYVWRYKKED